MDGLGRGVLPLLDGTWYRPQAPGSWARGRRVGIGSREWRPRPGTAWEGMANMQEPGTVCSARGGGNREKRLPSTTLPSPCRRLVFSISRSETRSISMSACCGHTLQLTLLLVASASGCWVHDIPSGRICRAGERGKMEDPHPIHHHHPTTSREGTTTPSPAHTRTVGSLAQRGTPSRAVPC